jgi:aspartate/tyrosine/aromatic aminotransferase
VFTQLPIFPADPLFSLQDRFLKDSNPNKINLGIGTYVTERGEPYVMPCVRKAAAAYATESFNYLPIGGHSGFLERAGSLLFGGDWDPEAFASQGTCGGTQAVALCRGLAASAGIRTLLLAEPTWVNHRTVFSDFDVLSFSHLDGDGRPDAAAYRAAIEAADKPCVLLLHGGPAHNPTGLNLSMDDFTSLAPLLRSRPVFVLVDFAYWGLGDGLEEDARGARLLARELDDVAVAVSFSKNATLYGQRVGALFVKSNARAAVESNMRRLVRTSVSNPPAFGEAVMFDVLANRYDDWTAELEAMRQSVVLRREMLADRCPRLSRLRETRGLFGMLGLAAAQIDRLREEFGIYVPDGGRINVAGIRTDAIEYLGRAFEGVR